MGEKVEGEKKVVDGGESLTVVVLNLDLHCEGCAKKVGKAVSHFEGVEKVKTDYTSNKLTVSGNVDPTWLRERIEYKTKKKVDLISPQPKKAAADGGAKKPHEKSDKKNEEKNKPEEKKPKEVPITTAVMKIKLHCDECAHKVKRVITKNIEGVNSVVTNLQKDLVTVTGTMNVKSLTSYLQEKLKRSVDTIPPGGAEEKKAGGAGGEEKKVEVNKMEHLTSNSETFYYTQSHGSHGYGHVAQYYSGNHGGYGNVAEYYRPGPPATEPMYFDDQMFSDENPTGCSVM